MKYQKKKLKPVVVNNNRYKSHSRAESQQVILLQALQVTHDPKKLREMMGVKTVAEVYRTLDKLAIRKEYHDALARAGFSLDKVVGGISQIAETAEKDDTRLKAYQTILKSLGLDKYEAADAPTGGTWEEELLRSLEREQNQPKLEAPNEDYEVEIPEVPESIKKMRQAEEDLTKGVYGD